MTQRPQTSPEEHEYEVSTSMICFGASPLEALEEFIASFTADPRTVAFSIKRMTPGTADEALTEGSLEDLLVEAAQDNLVDPDIDPDDAAPLTLATDGGASPNPGPAGWAWVDEHGRYSAGSMSHGTNNIAELTALEQALLDHPARPLRIVYDSKYAVMCATVWGPSWRSTGKTGKANQEQIFRIMDLLDRRRQAGVATEFEWVRGHSGHPLNELADQVATRMRLRGDDHLESGNIPIETQTTSHP